jgi:hypothetical protein
MKIRTLLVSSLLLVGATDANAAVVFSDNFNSYSPQLDWVPPANWTAPGPGTVDLIGAGTPFDFYPGNGFYVDMDGSNGLPGTLQTIQSFGPGSYTLTFDLGGNARGDVNKTTVITLGNFAASLTLASGAPLQLQTFSFTTTGGQLAFADLPGGNQDIGNILDNVTLSMNIVTGPGVPEASTWAMMLVGFAGLGFVGYRASRRSAAFAA